MTNQPIDRIIEANIDAAEYLSGFWVDDLEMLIYDIDTRKAVAERFGCSPAIISRLCEHYIPHAPA